MLKLANNSINTSYRKIGSSGWRISEKNGNDYLFIYFTKNQKEIQGLKTMDSDVKKINWP
jgi:hypothetical protein